MCKAKSATEDIYSRGQRSYTAWEFGGPAYKLLKDWRILCVFFISDEHEKSFFFSVLNLMLPHFRANSSWSLEESQKYRRYDFAKWYIFFLISPHSGSYFGSNVFILLYSSLFFRSLAHIHRVLPVLWQDKSSNLSPPVWRRPLSSMQGKNFDRSDWFIHPLNDRRMCRPPQVRGIVNTGTHYTNTCKPLCLVKGQNKTFGSSSQSFTCIVFQINCCFL